MIKSLYTLLKMVVFFSVVVLSVNMVDRVFVQPLGQKGTIIAGIAVWSIAGMAWIKSLEYR